MQNDEYTGLIYDMIQETRELELEIISLRYLLSTCMPGHYKEDLRSDIYTNTDPEFRDNPDYQKYVKTYFHGKDPFETRSYNRRLEKQAHGNIEVYKQYHPNMYLGGLTDYIWVKNNQIMDKQH